MDKREEIAELEHKQWMYWAKSLMEREQLSPERIRRWKDLMIPYSELTEEQKEQDRKWAELVLAITGEYEEVELPSKEYVEDFPFEQLIGYNKASSEIYKLCGGKIYRKKGN